MLEDNQCLTIVIIFTREMTCPSQTSFGDMTSFISTLIRVDNWSWRLSNEYKSPCKVKTFLLKASAVPGRFEHRFALLQQVELYLHLWRCLCLLITKTPHQHSGVPGLCLAGCPLGIETEVSGSLWGLRTELPSLGPQSWQILPSSTLSVSNLCVETSVRASAPSIAQDWNHGRKEWRQWKCLKIEE